MQLRIFKHSSSSHIHKQPNTNQATSMNLKPQNWVNWLRDSWTLETHSEVFLPWTSIQSIASSWGSGARSDSVEDESPHELELSESCSLLQSEAGVCKCDKSHQKRIHQWSNIECIQTSLWANWALEMCTESPKPCTPWHRNKILGECVIKSSASNPPSFSKSGSSDAITGRPRANWCVCLRRMRCPTSPWSSAHCVSWSGNSDSWIRVEWLVMFSNWRVVWESVLWGLDRLDGLDWLEWRLD